MDKEKWLRGRIRILLVGFIIGLVLSGITAFPLEWELKILAKMLHTLDPATAHLPGLHHWIMTVHDGLIDTYAKYPWLAYGTDWLAFGHIVIAISFIGPLRDPVKNIWVIEFGMIACILIIPLAMICGPIRGIPFYWRLIDCSFGVVGIIPLWLCRRYILRLDAIKMQPQINTDRHR